MIDLVALTSRNADRWARSRVNRDASDVARSLCADGAKARYQIVAQKTGVPWFVIALIHEREASQNWATNIAQGDRWDRVSIHVPRGRGPFRSFEAAAVDALTNCAPHAAHWTDWSTGGTLTLLEQYNGLGYAARGLASPYVWSGTDQYEKGKFVADGVFDPGIVDRQLGCVCILKAMMAIDRTIKFGGVAPPPKPPPGSVQPPSSPARPPFWAAFFLSIASIFRRK